MALDDLDGEKVGQQFLVHILKGHHWSRSTADHALKAPTRLFPIFTIIEKRKPAPDLIRGGWDSKAPPCKEYQVKRMPNAKGVSLITSSGEMMENLSRSSNPSTSRSKHFKAAISGMRTPFLMPMSARSPRKSLNSPANKKRNHWKRDRLTRRSYRKSALLLIPKRSGLS